VYPAAGSHAAYFSPSQWFGRSAASGFGCDDTRSPLVEVDPELIVLPDGVPTTGEFAWLSFAGHWGERQPIFNDGPTGPVTKDQWSEPVAWVDEAGRDGAVAIPFAGSTATDSFCDLSRRASILLLNLLDRPVLVALLTVAALVATVAIFRFSSRGLLGRAVRSWRAKAGRLLPIGAWMLVGAGAAALIQYGLLRWTRLGDVVDVVGGSTPWVLPIVAVAGSVAVVPAVAWVMAATLTPQRDGEGLMGTLRSPTPRRAAIVASLTLLIVGEVLLLVLLAPVAVYVLSRWMLAPAVGATENVGLRDGLRTSRRLVRGHGWRAAGLVVTLGLVGGLVGVVGAAVLVLTPFSFLVAGVATAAAGVVVVPVVALVVADFHDELVRNDPGATGAGRHRPRSRRPERRQPGRRPGSDQRESRSAIPGQSRWLR
jgi:hypothetical protein